MPKQSQFYSDKPSREVSGTWSISTRAWSISSRDGLARLVVSASWCSTDSDKAPGCSSISSTPSRCRVGLGFSSSTFSDNFSSDWLVDLEKPSSTSSRGESSTRPPRVAFFGKLGSDLGGLSISTSSCRDRVRFVWLLVLGFSGSSSLHRLRVVALGFVDLD